MEHEVWNMEHETLVMGTKYKAQLKYLHIAPRKVRSVVDLLRGLPVSEAEAQLLLHTRRPALPLLKLLRSAVANARYQNKTLNADALIIADIRVNQGPMLKRSLPRAMGRATPIQKKMSHVSMVLVETPAPQRSRFVIQPPEKKTKRPPKAKTAKPKVEAPKIHPKEKSGFFKRMFRRKAI